MFATQSAGRIDACTSNESIYCKQVHLKKKNKNYIVDEYSEEGAALDGSTEIWELLYLIIRDETKSTHLRTRSRTSGFANLPRTTFSPFFFVRAQPYFVFKIK